VALAEAEASVASRGVEGEGRHRAARPESLARGWSQGAQAPSSPMTNSASVMTPAAPPPVAPRCSLDSPGARDSAPMRARAGLRTVRATQAGERWGPESGGCTRRGLAEASVHLEGCRRAARPESLARGWGQRAQGSSSPMTNSASVMTPAAPPPAPRCSLDSPGAGDSAPMRARAGLRTVRATQAGERWAPESGGCTRRGLAEASVRLKGCHRAARPESLARGRSQRAQGSSSPMTNSASVMTPAAPPPAPRCSLDSPGARDSAPMRARAGLREWRLHSARPGGSFGASRRVSSSSSPRVTGAGPEGRVPLSVEKGWRPPGGMLMDGVYSRSV
jgi:hypothetical protein